VTIDSGNYINSNDYITKPFEPLELHIGADDYIITKPFEPLELLAKIEAQLKS
jgi:DNA-binding response OmpR family regulator